MDYRKILPVFVLALVLATNLFFGFPRLSQYSSVDEPYWTYDRTPDFWQAVKEQRWKRTDINDKPGITVAILSGLGLSEEINPLSLKSIRQEPKSPEISRQITRINWALRLPIYLASLAFLLLFYFLAKKLFNQNIALLLAVFLGLSPIILGISLIINPDSLLWGFLPLSVLSFLIYQNENRKKYLFFSGIFLGLALLTKYVANILFVYFFGLIFLNYLFSLQNKKNFSAYILSALRDYGLLIGTALLTFFLIYPKCWVEPKTVLEGTILSVAFQNVWPYFLGVIGVILVEALFFKSYLVGKIMNFLREKRRFLLLLIGIIFFSGVAFVFLNTFTGMKMADFDGEVASPKGENILSLSRLGVATTSDLYALIFSLSPLVLFFWLLALSKTFFSRQEFNQKSAAVLYFSLFVILYYLASTVNQVIATVRYQIAVYPLVFLSAAYGANRFLETERWKNFLEKYRLAAIMVIFFITAFSLFSVAPHFFTYSSSLLPQKYVLNLKDMGDGSFEAAQFLNNLPEPQNLTVWSDKGAVCETFLGKCKVSFNKSDTQNWNFDYFVVSTGRKSRSLKLEPAADFRREIDFEKAYATDFQNADFEIDFQNNENNFVRVIKTEKIIEE